MFIPLTTPCNKCGGTDFYPPHGRAKSRGRCKECVRRYRVGRKEHYAEYNKNYKIVHKDELIAYRKQYNGSLEGRFVAYRKCCARYRGFVWELTQEQFNNLVDKDCFYCGQIGGGIDRVDNSKGYTIDNCVTCCRRCNVAKNDMTLQEFVAWVQRVYNKVGH